MKIKHSIEVTPEEVDSVFEIVMKACLASYSTVEEQASHIAMAKGQFAVELEKLIKEAFKLGNKIGKAKADTKDTTMYSASTPTT